MNLKIIFAIGLLINYYYCAIIIIDIVNITMTIIRLLKVTSKY